MLSARGARRGLVAALVAVCAGRAAAADEPAVERVTVAPGVVAERGSHPCGAQQLGYGACVGWTLVGGAAALPETLVAAHAFAGAPGGRIVAAVRRGMYFSDDRGARWHAARWEWSGSARALAFDARGAFGVAVGTDGGVWTSDDRGSSWRLRRDGGSRTLTDVAVAGRTLVFVDDAGGAAVSPDGGTSIRTLAEGGPGAPPARLESDDHAIWVHTGGAIWWRVDSGGAVERAERRPRRR